MPQQHGAAANRPAASGEEGGRGGGGVAAWWCRLFRGSSRSARDGVSVVVGVHGRSSLASSARGRGAGGSWWADGRAGGIFGRGPGG